MDEREVQLLEGAIPANTKKGHRWAMKKFVSFLEKKYKNSNEKFDIENPEEKALEKELIDFFKGYKANEQLKELNNASFKQVLLGIAGHYGNFKIMSSPVFETLRKIVNGCIVERKHSCPPPQPKRDALEKEEILKILENSDLNDPNEFIVVAMFIFAIAFALRAGEELTYLEFSQFKIINKQDMEGLEFYPGEDKNHKEGLKGKKNPTRYVYGIEEEWCPLKIYKILLKRKNPNSTRLWCKPLNKIGEIWFSRRPIGENMVSKLLQSKYKYL